MLEPTHHRVTLEQLDRARVSYNINQSRTRLNRQTGRFFYDPWQLREEYRDTVWAELLDALPQPIGEARIIILQSQTCYTSHADIDNRYHLNIQGERSYLIDLDHDRTYPLLQDCTWYTMDASHLHTAANFGRGYRVQLVVRQLLTSSKIMDPIHCRIHSHRFGSEDSRFIFDNRLSSWLNLADKQGQLSDFDFTDSTGVEFRIASSQFEQLDQLVGTDFRLEILS